MCDAIVRDRKKMDIFAIFFRITNLCTYGLTKDVLELLITTKEHAEVIDDLIPRHAGEEGANIRAHKIPMSHRTANSLCNSARNAKPFPWYATEVETRSQSFPDRGHTLRDFQNGTLNDARFDWRNNDRPRFLLARLLEQNPTRGGELK